MSGWITKPLSEIAEVRYGTRVVRKKDVGSTFPVYGGGGATFSVDDYNRADCYIVSRFGMSAECVRYVSGRFFLNDSGLTVHTKSGEVLQEFLDRFLVSKQAEIYGLSRGTAQRNLDVPLFRALPISFPQSLEEQQRIVAVLDEAFAAIATATANAEKNLANARELFVSELNATFSTVHPGWRQGCLSDLMDVTHGFAFKGEDFESSDDDAKPVVLTPGNYTEDAEIVFSPRNTKRLIHGVPPPAFRFSAGDLTVVMTDLSSKMKILGRPAFVNGDNVLHNQRIGKVVFRDNSIEPRLVYYAMQTSTVLSRIRDTATGTMVRHTAPKRILANPITYPPDIGDQRALVERLDRVRSEANALRELQLAKIKTFTALKQSLLHRAFTGELTAALPETLAA